MLSRFNCILVHSGRRAPCVVEVRSAQSKEWEVMTIDTRDVHQATSNVPTLQPLFLNFEHPAGNHGFSGGRTSNGGSG
jgi:hypothetical protein